MKSEKPKVKKEGSILIQPREEVPFPNLHFQAIFKKEGIYMLLDLF